MEQLSREPVHLGVAGHIPGDHAADYECTRCADNFHDADSLTRIDNTLVCRPCLSACRCPKCNLHLTVEDWELCEDCLVAFFRAERQEFGDAVRLGLCNTELGRTIAKRVLGIDESSPESEPRAGNGNVGSPVADGSGELSVAQIIREIHAARTPTVRFAWCMALYTRGQVDAGRKLQAGATRSAA